MASNPARRARRAQRYGRRLPTRMTDYQRARQGEQPRGEVKVHAHLHGLDLNAAVELDEAGAFSGLPCGECDAAIEWSADTDEWQHHATKTVRCRGRRTRATPPDWYTGEEVIEHEAGEDLAADDHLAEDLTETSIGVEAEWPAEREPAPPKPPRVDGNPYDTEFARGVLLGLQTKATYQGTVQVDEVERRRLRNRDANRSRRANRRAKVKRSRERFARHRAAS